MLQSLIDQGKVDPADTELMRQFDDFEVMEQANRAALLDLLPKLARAFPDHKIILRPHPSEVSETWQRMDGGLHQPLDRARRRGHPMDHGGAGAGSHQLRHRGRSCRARPAVLVPGAGGQSGQPAISGEPGQSGGTTNVGATIRKIERVLADPQPCYSEKMIARFRDCMSYDEKRLGAEHIIADIVLRGTRAAGRTVQSRQRLAAAVGYRWHQKDKNVRGILFPDESLRPVEARLRQYAELLSLEIHLRVEACGSKVILLSARPLALGTRMHRAFGALKRI